MIKSRYLLIELEGGFKEKAGKSEIKSHGADCPAGCKTCKPAEVELDENGVCTQYCSKGGFCGKSEIYQVNGRDCRRCGDISYQYERQICCERHLGRFHDKLEDAKRECSELGFCIGVCIPKCSTGSAPYHLCSEDGWTSWDAGEDCSWVKVNKGRRL